MREPELRYVQGYKDGRRQVFYFEKCQCGASLMLTMVERVSRTNVVEEAFACWRSEHKGDGCGEVAPA